MSENFLQNLECALVHSGALSLHLLPNPLFRYLPFVPESIYSACKTFYCWSQALSNPDEEGTPQVTLLFAMFSPSFPFHKCSHCASPALRIHSMPLSMRLKALASYDLPQSTLRDLHISTFLAQWLRMIKKIHPPILLGSGCHCKGITTRPFLTIEMYFAAFKDGGPRSITLLSFQACSPLAFTEIPTGRTPMQLHLGCVLSSYYLFL